MKPKTKFTGVHQIDMETSAPASVVIATIYCGFSRETEVEQVVILETAVGAGITRCLECHGHRYFPALEPGREGLVICIQCKGTGYQLISAC